MKSKTAGARRRTRRLSSDLLPFARSVTGIGLSVNAGLAHGRRYAHVVALRDVGVAKVAVVARCGHERARAAQIQVALASVGRQEDPR